MMWKEDDLSLFSGNQSFVFLQQVHKFGSFLYMERPCKVK